MEKKRRFLTSRSENGEENSFFRERLINMFKSFASEHESLFLSYVETSLHEERNKFIIAERKGVSNDSM